MKVLKEKGINTINMMLLLTILMSQFNILVLNSISRQNIIENNNYYSTRLKLLDLISFNYQNGLLIGNIKIDELNTKMLLDTGSYISWFIPLDNFSNLDTYNKSRNITNLHNQKYYISKREDLNEVVNSILNKTDTLKNNLNNIYKINYKSGYVILLRKTVKVEIGSILNSELLFGEVIFIENKTKVFLQNINGLLALGNKLNELQNTYEEDTVINNKFNRVFEFINLSDKSSVKGFYFDFTKNNLQYFSYSQIDKVTFKKPVNMFDILSAEKIKFNDNLKEEFLFIETNSRSFSPWTIKIDKIQLISKENKLIKEINIDNSSYFELMFDSGTTNYVAEQSIFNQIQENIKVNEFCFNYEELPIINILFNIQLNSFQSKNQAIYNKIPKNEIYLTNLTIKPNQYISKKTQTININKSNEEISFEKCLLNFESYKGDELTSNELQPVKNKPIQLILGIEFLKNFLVLFDTTNNRIGLKLKDLKLEKIDEDKIRNKIKNIYKEEKIGLNREEVKLEEQWIKVYEDN